MKKIIYLLIIPFLFACNQFQNLKEFKTETLKSLMITNSGKEISFQKILDKHKGKPILIDVWASWCGDCIQGLPGLKSIQKKYPNTSYVFLSLDRNFESWQRGIQKYRVKGDHYFVKSGWKGSFYKSIHGNWIPRYIFINPKGKIEVYRAIKTDDKQLINALKTNN